MPKAAALVIPVCCLGQLAAQAVHLVGPGGYPQITAAIAAAAPGDIVLVQPGQYDMFFLGKALTIRATAPGAEAVVASASPLGSANIVWPPAGATVHIVGMTLGTTYLWGTSTLDGCVIDTPRGSLFIDGATAVLQGCALLPVLPNPPFLVSPTLRCTNADVTVLDSTIQGVSLSATITTIPIDLVNTRFRGSGLTVYSPGPGFWPALQGDAASRVWLSDSTLTSAPGACGLPVLATVLAANGRYDRCTLTPNCSLLPAGFVLGVRAPQPPQNGAPFTLEFRAQPNSMVGVFAAHTIERSTLPILDQSALLATATAFNVGNLIADNTGLAVGTWLLPPGAVFVDFPLWFQGVAGPAFPLQVSGVAGGLVR